MVLAIALCLAQRGRKSLTSPGLKNMTYRQPAECAQHDWAWIGFPSNPAEWPNVFEGARMQSAAFANAEPAHCKGRSEEHRGGEEWCSHGRSPWGQRADKKQ